MKTDNSLAPICLFVYSRLNETRLTVESLQRNILAADSELFIFADGSKNQDNIYDIRSVREYIHSITGFANITIYESNYNKGLANSIISGVSEIIERYGKVIVLEDDLILATNFLSFMNQALDFYETKRKILSVSGFSFEFMYPEGYKYDVAFSIRAASWGWATWKDRWTEIDWEIKDYVLFRRNLRRRIAFNSGGSDLSHLLDRQMKGDIDSWAIRFVYHQHKYRYLDVFPIKSKVLNIGFDNEATHTKARCDRFETSLDMTDQYEFSFLTDVFVDKNIIKQFYKHHSIRSRLRDKMMNILYGK